MKKNFFEYIFLFIINIYDFILKERDLGLSP